MAGGYAVARLSSGVGTEGGEQTTAQTSPVVEVGLLAFYQPQVVQAQEAGCPGILPGGRPHFGEAAVIERHPGRTGVTSEAALIVDLCGQTGMCHLGIGIDVVRKTTAPTSRGVNAVGSLAVGLGGNWRTTCA